MLKNICQKCFNIVKNNLLLVIIIAVVIVTVAGVSVYSVYFKEGDKIKIISAQAAGLKAVDYINNNFLQGQGKISLKETSEANGLYKLKLTLEDNGQTQDSDAYVTKDGKYLFPVMPGWPIDLDQKIEEPLGTTIGNFTISNEEVCKENGKPIVYFFGSQSCLHCQWEHPVVEDVVAKFGTEISFHNNMDVDDDQEVFSKYSDGGIPALVIGCKYYRVGSGESAGEEQETKDLTALICKLTGNKPESQCNKVQDLIDQITE